MREPVIWRGPRIAQLFSCPRPSAQYMVEEASRLGFLNLSTIHI